MNRHRDIYVIAAAAMLVACTNPPWNSGSTTAGDVEPPTLETLEKRVALAPNDAEAQLQLAEVRLETALETDDHAMLLDADSSFARAANHGEPPSGAQLVKHAIALQRGLARREADVHARRAWECCHEPAALFVLSDEDEVVRLLTHLDWEAGPWRQRPSAASVPVRDRTHFLIEDTSDEEEGESGRPRLRLIEGRIEDDEVVFVDRGSPKRTTEYGYVKRAACRQGNVSGRRVKCMKGPLDSKYWGDKRIRNGPCWFVCRRGTHAKLVPMRGVDESSIRCIPGSYSFSASSCKVSFERVTYPTRRVSLSSAYPLVSQEYARPTRIAYNSGRDGVAARIANGEIAVGMPVALLVESGERAYGFDEDAIAMKLHSPIDGSLLFVNGLLALWQPPPN